MSAVTNDAKKRLEAIESIETLGTGFTLATHDLEIRGAGELLGDEQSGQIQEIGYTLYTELLERAVKALKEGRDPSLEESRAHFAEIDLHMPALIPEDYLPDVHERLIMYKRIASATNKDALRELQVEMIDRFGLLPEPARTLFQISGLKLKATALGIRKVDLAAAGGQVTFTDKPDIDPMLIIKLIQQQAKIYKLDGAGNKLRIAKNLENRADRLKELQQLLGYLQNRHAA